MRSVKLADLGHEVPDFKSKRGSDRKPQCFWCPRNSHERTVKFHDEGRAHVSCHRAVMAEAMALAEAMG